MFLPVAAVATQWTLYGWLSLVIPVAATATAILAAVWVASKGWKRALTTSLAAQKEGARLSSIMDAETELLAFLNHVVAWSEEARRFLLYTASAWKTPEDSAVAMADVDRNESKVHLKSSALLVRHEARSVRKAVMWLPISSLLVLPLRSLAFSIEPYWDIVARQEASVRTGSTYEDGVRQYELGAAFLAMNVEFCQDLEIAVLRFVQGQLRQSDVAPTEALPEPSGNWIGGDREGPWFPKKFPPGPRDLYIAEDQVTQEFAGELAGSRYDRSFQAAAF